jgi:hypothetical protein
MMLFQIRQHLTEVRPAARLGGFDCLRIPSQPQNPCLRHTHAAGDLGRDAESFRFLILARHSYVEHHTSRLMRRRARGRSGRG